MNSQAELRSYEHTSFDTISNNDRYSTSFYDASPQYYDIVTEKLFSMRVSHFLCDCADYYGLTQFNCGLDIACGTGRYAIDLAKRGFSMSAIDLSKGMLEYAHSQAQSESIAVSFHQGNMITFRLDEPVDFAINLGENLGYILSDEEMIFHFNAVADSLHPRGLYFCQVSVPVYHWSTGEVIIRPPYIVYQDFSPIIVTGTRDDTDVTLNEYSSAIYLDPFHQLYHTRLKLEVRRSDSERIYEKPEVERLYYPLEFKSLLARSGRFEFLGWFNDYSLDAPLTYQADAIYYIVVMRRL